MKRLILFSILVVIPGFIVACQPAPKSKPVAIGSGQTPAEELAVGSGQPTDEMTREEVAEVRRNDCDTDGEAANTRRAQLESSEANLTAFLADQVDQASPTHERLGTEGATARLALIRRFRELLAGTNSAPGVTWKAGTLGAEFNPRTLQWLRRDAATGHSSPVDIGAIDTDVPAFSCNDYQTNYTRNTATYQESSVFQSHLEEMRFNAPDVFDRFFQGMIKPVSERALFRFERSRLSARSELFDGANCSLVQCVTGAAARGEPQCQPWLGNRELNGGGADFSIEYETVNDDLATVDGTGRIVYQKNGAAPSVSGVILIKATEIVEDPVRTDSTGQPVRYTYVNQRQEIHLSFLNNDKILARYVSNKIYDTQNNQCVNESSDSRIRLVNRGYLLKRVAAAARR